MVTSLEEAVRLFKKWAEENSSVRLLLWGPTSLKGLAFGGLVSVQEISRDSVRLAIGPSATLTLSLGGCEFRYSEPSEEPEFLRRLVELRTEFALSIVFPFGMFGCFMHPRSE
jgi:hypothetical protein